MIATDRFVLHPAARITGADAGLLRAALARAATGAAFRIGAVDAPPPADATPPVFETLTSGSSGAPRRILRQQASWTASFAVNAGFGIGPAARVAVLGRLDHSLSLYGAVEAACLGADLYLLGGQRPDRQARALAADAVAYLYATPAQLRLLADANLGLPALRRVFVGGSKLDPALRARLSGLAPAAQVSEFYGAAESSFITMADAGDDPASVGRAYAGVSISIRDAAGRALPEGQAGAVWVSSPYLFLSYAGPDTGSARRDGDWLTVGEVGFLQNGLLYLSGRAGRMVTIADQNVFPEGVEAVLAELSGITRVAVLPRADAKRGTVLVAVAQGDAAQTDAILAAARARLGPLIAPRALFWVTDWPVLSSGKTDLAALAAQVQP